MVIGKVNLPFGNVIVSYDPPMVWADGKYYLEGVGEIDLPDAGEDWRDWKYDKDCNCKRCKPVRIALERPETHPTAI